MPEQKPPHIDFGWIDSQDGLVELVDELLEMPRYALDTEFHRERTYFPKLALIQIAWWPEGTNEKQELVLIDPLDLDVSDLGRLFATDSLCSIDRWTIGVSTVPGQIALMRIPVRAFSADAVFVRPRTPCFDAQ